MEKTKVTHMDVDSPIPYANNPRLNDNETSEFAEWDMDKLQIELEGIDEIDMGEFGFDDALDLSDDMEPIDDEEIGDAMAHEHKNTGGKTTSIWRSCARTEAQSTALRMA